MYDDATLSMNVEYSDLTLPNFFTGNVCSQQSFNTLTLRYTADLKVIYLHNLLKIVGNSVSNVQIAFISSDLLRSSLFGITCFWLIPVFDFGL